MKTRKHLTVSQRAMVAQKFLGYAEERAKARQVAGAKKSANPVNMGEQVRANLPQPIDSQKSTDEVAQEFKVSGRSVRDANPVDPAIAGREKIIPKIIPKVRTK